MHDTEPHGPAVLCPGGMQPKVNRCVPAGRDVTPNVFSEGGCWDWLRSWIGCDGMMASEQLPGSMHLLQTLCMSAVKRIKSSECSVGGICLIYPHLLKK